MCYFFLFYMSSPAIIMKYFIKIQHEVMTVTEKESKFTLEYQSEVFPSAFY